MTPPPEVAAHHHEGQVYQGIAALQVLADAGGPHVGDPLHQLRVVQPAGTQIESAHPGDACIGEQRRQQAARQVPGAAAQRDVHGRCAAA